MDVLLLSQGPYVKAVAVLMHRGSPGPSVRHAGLLLPNSLAMFGVSDTYQETLPFVIQLSSAQHPLMSSTYPPSVPPLSDSNYTTSVSR